MTEERNHYLYERAVQYLALEILNHLNKKNYRLPTEAEIANKLGVSRITATKAYKIIEELGVIRRIKGSGSYIAPEATAEMLAPVLKQNEANAEKKIGIIYPFASTHVMKILAGVLAKLQGHPLLIGCSDMSLEREQQLIVQYLNDGADALLLYPVDNDIYNNILLNLMLRDYPVVLLDRYLNGLNFNYVSSDHKQAIAAGISVLVQAGHRRMLFFDANRNNLNSTVSQRRDHYINSLRSHAISHTYFYSIDGEQDETSMRFADDFDRYLKENPNITAIITADYASSMHLMKLISVMDRERAARYEIVCLDLFSENFESYLSHPTLVEQNSAQLGEEAAKLALRCLTQGVNPKQNVTIPVRLVKKRDLR